MAASQAQKNADSPLQKLHVGLRNLEKIADAGDLRAWQENLPAVEKMAQELLGDSVKLLETQVEIKMHELTLFLKAGKGALHQAQVTEREAKEAELVNQTHSRELWAKAQKFQELGEHFLQRLKSNLG